MSLCEEDILGWSVWMCVCGGGGGGSLQINTVLVLIVVHKWTAHKACTDKQRQHIPSPLPGAVVWGWPAFAGTCSSAHPGTSAGQWRSGDHSGQEPPDTPAWKTWGEAFNYVAIHVEVHNYTQVCHAHIYTYTHKLTHVSLHTHLHKHITHMHTYIYVL